MIICMVVQQQVPEGLGLHFCKALRLPVLRQPPLQFVHSKLCRRNEERGSASSKQTLSVQLLTFFYYISDLYRPSRGIGYAEML